MNPTNSPIRGSLAICTLVSPHWETSLRFYQQVLGYQVLDQGELNPDQRNAFGTHLNRFALLGYDEGAVLRILETRNSKALPVRLCAKPWDTGLAVLEAGTPDIMRVYYKAIRNRFGAISVPQAFSMLGPEPLGKITMKSGGFMGPAGEQLFVTEIVEREGGESLLKEKAVAGVNAPGNVVMSLQDRQVIEQFWKPLLGIHAVNDLPLQQASAASIMGGPENMAFDMLLMGYGKHRIGLEQHIYGPYHADFTFNNFPCHFEQSGLISAGWEVEKLGELKKNCREQGIEIISQCPLPGRNQVERTSLFIKGPLGEILEFYE